MLRNHKYYTYGAQLLCKISSDHII